jgi:uncharacterized membrane protein
MQPTPVEPAAFTALGALAWVLAAGVLVAAAGTADWRRVSGDDEAHRFWGAATAIAVLWHADPVASAGLHLLGAATVCALFGLRIALVALAAGTGLQHVADGLDPAAWPVAFLAGAALPAAVAHAGLTWAVRGRGRFGPLPWVAGAFATGAASMAASLAMRAWVGPGVGAPAPTVPDATTGVALLLAMAFAEAQLSAGVVATVAAQRPHWLAEPGSDARAPRRGGPPRR